MIDPTASVSPDPIEAVSSPPRFTVHLKLFAIYQEVVGQSDLPMQVAAGTTVDQLCDQLIGQYPSLAAWKQQTRFGINFTFVPPETSLRPHDEVVLIPPVSGG